MELRVKYRNSFITADDIGRLMDSKGFEITDGAKNTMGFGLDEFLRGIIRTSIDGYVCRAKNQFRPLSVMTSAPKVDLAFSVGKRIREKTDGSEIPEIIHKINSGDAPMDYSLASLLPGDARRIKLCKFDVEFACKL